MNQENINRKILETYELCGVDSFPLDGYSILQCFGFKVYSYSKIRALDSELFSMCQNFSADAFRFKNIICFNDLKPKERICFSLMHELGITYWNIEAARRSVNLKQTVSQVIYLLLRWSFIFPVFVQQRIFPEFFLSPDPPLTMPKTITKFGQLIYLQRRITCFITTFLISSLVSLFIKRKFVHYAKSHTLIP